MSLIVEHLAKILPTIRSHGNFYATGRTAIFAPKLEVDGVGRIALPLLPVQAEQLIAAAERAPYGRGEDTIIDTDVRRTWQIGAKHIHLGGRDWQQTIDRIAAQAAAGLGVTAPVSAELYKLLIYDTGSFFLEHRDTEKEPGMFATLVIVLPSEYSGGELIVRHGDREVCLELGTTESSDVAYAAFYADCVHEMRPVTSGYRLTLIFNLVRQGKGAQPVLQSYTEEKNQIVEALQHWATSMKSAADDDDSPEKVVYPLEHAYTSAEFGFDTLKNADAAVATVLADVADQADCDVHLAFVSIEENGWAEYNGRRSYGRGYRYDDDDDDDENYEIGEVIDRIEAVSEWQHPDGSRPNIAALPLQNGELCPADAFEGEEPDEQYFHEATGNAGASFERTYRRAALVLWPRSRLLANISRAGLDVSMPYLTDIVQRWIESGEGMASPLWDEAHTLVAHMLVHWPVPLWHSRNEQSAKMLSILEKMRDTEHIDSFLSDVSAGGKYSENENEALVRAAGLLPPSRVADLIEKIVTKNASNTPDACANLLALITDAAAFSEALALLYPAAQVVVDFLVGARVDPALLDARRRPLSFGCDYISDLMYALWRMDAVALADGAMNYVLTHPERFNLDAVLVPAALALRKKLAAQDFAPTQRLLQACMVHLQARIAEPLLPPADARRACAIACPCTHCKELSRFLDDPTRYSWAYKAAQSLRSHIESSIRNNDCDLTCVTETRSRPYVLVCTKNQASYDRRVQQRRRDIQDAAQIGVE